MKTTRLGGLAVAMVTCVGALSGCAAGGADMAPPAAASQPSSYSKAVDADAPAPAPAYGAPVEASPAPPPPPSSVARRAEAQASEAKKDEVPREERPGLGTEWGETRRSGMTFVDFDRADPSSPFVTASLFYNDEEGARAVSGGALRRIPRATFDVGGGLVSLGLRDEGGSFYSGFVAGSRDYVVGEAGHRYTIVVKNKTDARLEIVLSVDGLDVRDGKSASFDKRGYILDPRGEIEIDGFRQSLETVAAFRFGSVRGSYAGQKYGDTRNVGVIGLAVFNEVGSAPWRWTPSEIEQRRNANPFPAEFATPPGR